MEETTLLKPGVGLIKDEILELIKYGFKNKRTQPLMRISGRLSTPCQLSDTSNTKSRNLLCLFMHKVVGNNLKRKKRRNFTNLVSLL
jgi:hypothetical protein